ncbi:MAG: hypothetical protein LBV72_13465 [Tannerella sp.]|jgi:hypothetical protein|nr:hypothetical protein [Tannerella sp.]
MNKFSFAWQGSGHIGNKIVDGKKVISSITSCSNLKGIWAEGCKHISKDGQKLIDTINNEK